MSFTKHPNSDLYNSDATTKSFVAWSRSEQEKSQRTESQERQPDVPDSRKKKRSPFYSARNGGWRDPIVPESK